MSSCALRGLASGDDIFQDITPRFHWALDIIQYHTIILSLCLEKKSGVRERPPYHLAHPREY